MVKLRLIFFTVILNLFLIQIKSQKCPRICECSRSPTDRLRKILCKEKNIVNPLEVNPKVQILDFSHNEITTLDNSAFDKLTDLEILVLYKNAIHTIYLNVFSSLKNLRHLDLSDNNLEFIDNRILENNENLKSLDLSLNKFMSIQNTPFLISQSLEILNLQESQIAQIYSNTFSELPKLRTLDLSKNLLILLNIKHIRYFGNLTWIKLDNNKWICDINFAKSIELLEKNGVRVFINQCKKIDSSKNVMFERMIELPTVEINTKTTSTTDWTEEEYMTNTSYKFFDHILDEECSLEDPHRACNLFEKCQEYYAITSSQLQHLIDNNRADYDYCSPFTNNKTYNRIIFLNGFVLGTLFGSVFFYGIYCLLSTKCMRKREERREERRERRCEVTSFTSGDISGDLINSEPSGNIFFPEYFSSHTVQRTPRRGNTRRQPRQESETVSFFASLFKRRRTYPRRPSLIRRLSRSNLFSSTFRLSTIQSSARTEAQTSRNIEADRLLNDLTTNSNSTESMHVPNRNGDYTVLSTRPDPIAGPPPSYEDCIVLNVRQS